MSAEINLLSEFRDLIQKRNFGALEERWIAAIEGGSTGPSEVDAFLDAADALLSASERSRADVLLDMTIPAVESRVESPRLLALLRRRLRAAPDDGETRARFAKCFLETYGAGSVEAEYLRLSNLEKSSDLEKALRALDRWMRFSVGAFVHHASGWGAGQVQSLDPILKQAVVHLEKKPNHRMSLEAMGAVLEPLAADHFWVLQYQGGERIRTLIEENPVELVDILLRSFGSPLSLKELKLHLTPQHIPSSSWAKWWNSAKKRMRQKGFYRIEDKAPYRVERVHEEISYEQELLKSYRAEKDWARRQSLAKKILKEEGKQSGELREAVAADLQNTLETGSGAQALFAAYLLDRFTPGAAEPRMPRALRSCADPVKAINELEGPDEQRLALASLPELVGDRWPRVALELFSTGSDAVRDAIFARMDQDGFEEMLTRKVTAVMAGPRLNADLFTWCVRKLLEGQRGKVFAALEELTALALLQVVLDLLEYLAIRCERESDSVMRELLNRSRGVLAFRNYDLFRRALAGIEFDQGRELYKRVLSSLGLHDHVRVALLEIVTKTMPELTRPKDKPFWEDDCIYVTPKGLQKRQEELRDLMEEKLPKNFQDIGRAASFGDLRENAEYKAALEQRDFLTAKATEIRAEVTRARPIEAGMLKSGEVTLGSKVSLENVANGRKSVYRILGPWDGGPDEGVLSYKSPLARSFLGARLGQEVEVKLPGSTERYRITAVEPGIDG